MMVKYKKLVTVLALKVVPFLKTVLIYFLTSAHNHANEYWATFFKCSPIVSLIIFIVLHAVNWPSRETYEGKILLGLIFSCLGDALLNHNYFTYGMCAFAITQLFYIAAFGFKPLKLEIGCILYAMGATTVVLIWNNLSLVMAIGLPIYTILLLTMCWRSFARLFCSNISEDIPRLLGAIGSALFVISDSIIAINKFYSPVLNSSLWIMSTYYAGQFGITLSIIDNQKNYFQKINRL